MRREADTTRPNNVPYLGDTRYRRGALVTSSPAPTINEVADLLDMVADANRRVAAEVDRLAVSPVPVTPATVDRLSILAQQVQPGARARTQLSQLDPGLLLAGTSVWLTRWRRPEPQSAAARAQARWGGFNS
jgi:hypothetical protein